MLDARSEARLKGVHPHLVRVIKVASTMGGSFIVTEGLRTLKRQALLVEAGASRTMKSRHLTGHAVDLACLINGGREVSWKYVLYEQLNEIIQEAARLHKASIVWGGTFRSFKDGCHWELSRKEYP